MFLDGQATWWQARRFLLESCTLIVYNVCLMLGLSIYDTRCDFIFFAWRDDLTRPTTFWQHSRPAWSSLVLQDHTAWERKLKLCACSQTTWPFRSFRRTTSNSRQKWLLMRFRIQWRRIMWIIEIIIKVMQSIILILFSCKYCIIIFKYIYHG